MQNNTLISNHFSIKQANWCLFFLLLAYVAVDFLQIVLEGILGLNPGILFYIIARMAAIAPVVLFALSSKKRFRSLRFSKTSVRNIVYAALIGFFCYLLTSVLITYLAELILRSGGVLPGNEVTDYVLSGSAAFAFIFFVVFAPFTEEIFLRGVFQNAYEKRVGAYAVVLSGLVFGLLHADLLSIIYGMIAGLLLGEVYRRTRSLWCSIAFHATFNYLGYTLLADNYILNLPWTIGLLPTVSSDVFQPAVMVYWIGIMSISALLIYVFLRLMDASNSKRSFRMDETQREKYEMVPFILACVMLAFRAVLGTLAYFIR